MASISSIALSGMNAAQTQLNASAHNVANLPTEGFRRHEVVVSEQAGGGATTQTVRSATVGSALETDVLTQLQAKHAFLANLAVFKTSDKMAGALLDNTAEEVWAGEPRSMSPHLCFSANDAVGSTATICRTA